MDHSHSHCIVESLCPVEQFNVDICVVNYIWKICSSDPTYCVSTGYKLNHLRLGKALAPERLCV